jgi:hypothetical protein
MTVKAIKEMLVAKKLMKMSIKEVMPEYLYSFNLKCDITSLFTKTMPVIQTILLAATQSSRSIRENTRSTTPVSPEASFP